MARSPFSFLNRVLTNTASFAIGGAIQPTLEPLVIELANMAWSEHPNRPLSAQDAAEAWIRDAMGLDAAALEASYTGFNEDRFAVLRQLAGNAPGAEEALAAWNRGLIGEADVDEVLRKGRIRPEFYGLIKGLRWAVPSVTDMVRFAVREAYDPASVAALDLDAEFPPAFAEDAKRVGLRGDDLHHFWRAHWQLPSYTEAVEMLHRGAITQAQFDALLKAQDYAPTWRAKLQQIATRIPPITDMIRFAVREVYDPAQRRSLRLDEDYPAAFTAQAALHGMSAEDAGNYWAAHWRLPSAEQGYAMFHRGLITAKQLDDLLKALDYSPAWRQKLADLAYHVPGRIDLRRMYQADLINRAQAVRGYIALGYRPADAELMVQLAGVTGRTTARGLTAADLAAEYDGLLLSAAEYRDGLRELGYTQSAAAGKVRVADAKRRRTARNQLVGRARSRFVAWRITEADVRAALTAARIQQTEATELLRMWRAEREINQADLTPAQIKKAVRSAIMPKPEAVAELIARGYSDREANTLLNE